MPVHLSRSHLDPLDVSVTPVFLTSNVQARGERTIFARLSRALNLPPGRVLEVAAVGVSVPFSMLTISQDALQNAQFGISIDFAPYQTVTLREGTYRSIQDVDREINYQLLALGIETSSANRVFTLEPDFVGNQIHAVLNAANGGHTNVQVSFDVDPAGGPSFAKEMGFVTGLGNSRTNPIAQSGAVPSDFLNTDTVLFNDSLFTGIVVESRGSLRGSSMYGGNDTRSVLSRIDISPLDTPGSNILLARTPTWLPLIGSRVEDFSIHFLDSRLNELIFLSGEAAVDLAFRVK